MNMCRCAVYGTQEIGETSEEGEGNEHNRSPLDALPKYGVVCVAHSRGCKAKCLNVRVAVDSAYIIYRSK